MESRPRPNLAGSVKMDNQSSEKIAAYVSKGMKLFFSIAVYYFPFLYYQQ